jgi:AraC-like DNA-binding protein
MQSTSLPATVTIHKLCSSVQPQTDFKLCYAKFSEPKVLDDPIQRDLFNIIWVKKGKARYLIDFESYEVDGEAIFFLNPGQAFSVVSEVVQQGYRLAFSQDFHCVETYHKASSCNGILFNNVYKVPFILPESGLIPELENIVKKMIDEFENPGYGQQELIQSYLRLFLVLATRQSNAPQAPETNDFLRDFSFLVEKNFHTLHQVSDYADLLGIAPKTLTKKIKQLQSKSPSDIIKARLILEAKRLLRYSDKQVKEIAYELGFDDPAYFNRFFKKEAGVAPQQFRVAVNQ